MSRRSHRWSKFTPREDIPRWLDRMGMEAVKRRGLDPSWLDYRDYGKWQFLGPRPMGMAMQGLGGYIIIGQLPNLVTGFAAGPTIDADGEGFGMVFESPATGSITGAGFRTNIITTADANTLVQLQSVAGTNPATPNGIISAGVSGTVNVAASGTWYNVTFGTPYSATKGELMALTVTRQAGGSLNCTFVSVSTISGQLLPYAVVEASAGWVQQDQSRIMALDFNGTYHVINGMMPFSAMSSDNFDEGDTPNEIGNAWTPPFKCRVVGCWILSDLDIDAVFKLYDTDGATVLTSNSYTAGEHRIQNSLAMHYFMFPDNVTLSANPANPYRLVMAPGTSAFNNLLYNVSVSTAAMMDMLPLGQSQYYTSAKDPAALGDWTNTLTKRANIGFIIDQLDDGAGAGGGFVPMAME